MKTYLWNKISGEKKCVDPVKCPAKCTSLTPPPPFPVSSVTMTTTVKLFWNAICLTATYPFHFRILLYPL